MLETMKAAIFDMDGTLIDSMTRWREMNGAFVRQMGIIPTEKQEADMMSMSGTMVVDYFKNEFRGALRQSLRGDGTRLQRGRAT